MLVPCLQHLGSQLLIPHRNFVASHFGCVSDIGARKVHGRQQQLFALGPNTGWGMIYSRLLPVCNVMSGIAVFSHSIELCGSVAHAATRPMFRMTLLTARQAPLTAPSPPPPPPTHTHTHMHGSWIGDVQQPGRRRTSWAWDNPPASRRPPANITDYRTLGTHGHGALIAPPTRRRLWSLIIFGVDLLPFIT